MTLRGNEAETFLLSRGRLTFGIGGGSGIGGGAKGQGGGWQGRMRLNGEHAAKKADI